MSTVSQEEEKISPPKDTEVHLLAPQGTSRSTISTSAAIDSYLKFWVDWVIISTAFFLAFSGSLFPLTWFGKNTPVQKENPG